MFNVIEISPNVVLFKSMQKHGIDYYYVNKPAAIGAGQWISFWEGVREFHDSQNYDFQSLQNRIDDLENDVAELESERDGLEDELVDFQRDYDELEKQHNELQFRIESLEK